MSLAECQEKVNAREFVLWKIRHRKKPFGPAHEDYRFGLLYGLLCNLLQSWSSKKIDLPKIEEVFPSLKQEGGQRQSPRQMVRVAKALALMAGGKIVRGRRKKAKFWRIDNQGKRVFAGVR